MHIAKGVHPLLLVPPALVVALALDQGGFDPSAWVWSGALAAWAAAVAVVAARDIRVPRLGLAWAATAAAMLAWVALSWVWSDRRTQTALELRRTAVYAAAVLALVVLARRGAEKHLLVSTHIAISAVVVYALARYLTEARTFDTFEGTLLAQPLGYANALGVLAAIGVILGIGLAAQGHTSAAATVPVLAAALPLTQSRGAIVALGIGLVAVLAFADDGSPFARTTILVAPGSVLAAVVAATSRLDDENLRPYVHAAFVVGIVTLACAALTAVAASRVHVPAWRPHVPRPALTGVVVAGVIVAAVASGSTEPRRSYWGVAWHQFERHVAGGSGAGTYALAWAQSGLVESRGGALDAHSLYLETLAELGLVGLVILLAFLAVPLIHAKRAPVAAGAYVVFLVHAGLDWDWEMPAVVLAGLCCGAVVLMAGADQPRAITNWGRRAIAALAIGLGAITIAGARSSSEPGVAPPRSVAVVLGARVAVLPVAVPVSLAVVLPLRSGLGRAGREGVAVPEMSFHSAIRHGDHPPRMLLRVRAMTDRHAVLPARRAVLVA